MARYRTVDGDMIDAICKAQYGTEDMVEQVYEANPRLARLGPVLDKGHVIELPDAPVQTVRSPIRLWSAT